MKEAQNSIVQATPCDGGVSLGIRGKGSITASINDGTVMDIKSAAGFLCISEAKLRRLVYEERVPFFRIDGRILFFRPSVESWIQTLIVQPVGASVDERVRDAAATIWNTSRGGR